MRHSLFCVFFLLSSSKLSCLAQNVEPPGYENIDDPEMSKRLIDYWADSTCYKFSDNTEPDSVLQCKDACFPGDLKPAVRARAVIESSTSCLYSGPESNALTGIPLKEEEMRVKPRPFKTITPGYCLCNDPVVNFFGNFFITSVVEMGKVLEKVMCPLLKALDLVIELGSAAIPGVGKAMTLGMRTAIKTSKMYKYGYDATEAANEWASLITEQGFGFASEAGCGAMFSFSKADVTKRFLDLANAPDELIPELDKNNLPCPKGKKASKECKKKNGDDDDEKPSSKPADSIRPAPSSNAAPATSSKAPAASNQLTHTSSKPSTTTDTGPTASSNCDSIGKRDLDILLKEDGVLEKRIVGQTFQSRRLDGRSPKAKPDGQACKGHLYGKDETVKLPSKKYPPSGDPVMNDASAYGFNIIHDCSDYGWGKQKIWKSTDYDTEHVLEWSMVQNFFTVVNDHPDFKDGFEHPDPAKKEIVNPEDRKGPKIKNIVGFCKYWAASWVWRPRLGGMPNPAPNTEDDKKMQGPLGWLAEAYPFIDGETEDARRAYEDEFILLQKRINANPKNSLFSTKADQQIYNDNDMENMIQRKSNKKEAVRKGSKTRALKFGEYHDQPRYAIQRMRSLVGAFLYMKEVEVNTIFIAQVDRIGAQLEHIENALAKNPQWHPDKVPTPDGKGLMDGRIEFDKWKPLKLKEKWFAYMDEVYANANKKGQDFMRLNLKRLNDEYNDAKLITENDIKKEKDEKKREKLKLEKKLREDMKIYIPKLEAKWKDANSWSKPKWNSKAGGS